MRTLKILTIFLVALGFAVCGATTSLLMADENDPPHQTHLSADTDRGPSSFFLVEGLDVDDECLRCHTQVPQSNEDWNTPWTPIAAAPVIPPVAFTTV